MLCEHARDYLLDYMDNELPGVLQQELAEHLRACAECQEELEALRKTGLLLQLRAVPEPAAEYWEKAWSSIRARTTATVLPLSSRTIFTKPSWLGAQAVSWRARLAIAALLIAGIAGALLSWRTETVSPPWADHALPPPVMQPASSDLTEEMERQVEIINYTTSVAGSPDPISKSMRFAKLETAPR